MFVHATLLSSMLLILNSANLYSGFRENQTTAHIEMYAWLGYDAAGRLTNREFDRFFIRASKLKNVTIAHRPNNNEILSSIAGADIVYANTHSGYPKEGRRRMILQTGSIDDGPGEISSYDLLELYKNIEQKPTLVIINGCSTLADHPDGRVLKINEGFGIVERTEGRAYIGSSETVVGVRGDEFFRVFFGCWTRTPYVSLAQAMDDAKTFLQKRHYHKFINPKTYTVAEKMEIVGDDTMTFPDFLEKCR